MDAERRLFEEEAIAKAVLKLALPTIAATLVTVLYNFADTYFVGQLNDSHQTAAVTLGGNVTLLFIAVENLFGIGGASIFGRALGGKDETLARQSAAFSLWWAGIASLIFSLIYCTFQTPICSLIGTSPENVEFAKQYMFYAVTLGALPAIVSFVFAILLRTEGRANISMYAVTIGVVLNIILDPLFIYPQFLDMGCAGAGLATFLGNLVSCLIYIAYCRIKKESIHLSLSIRYIIPARSVLNNVLQVGIPAAIQNMLNVVGITILNRLASLYGSDAIAAMGIAYKLYMMPMYIITAFTQGVMPIISYNFGAGNFPRIRESISFAIKCITVYCIGVVVVLHVFAPEMVRTFLDVDKVVYLGACFTRVLSYGLLFLAIDFGVVAVCQSVGMGKKTLYFAIVRKALLEIPLFIILQKTTGVIGLALATPVTEAVMAAITVWILVRMVRTWGPENG